MAFNPEVNETLSILERHYRIAGHPLYPDVPYGQEGRQGTVYKLTAEDDGSHYALKVLRPTFRHPALVYQSEQLGAFSGISGLEVCAREVLTPQRSKALLSQKPELLYAVLMPWIDGRTWMDVIAGQEELSVSQSCKLAGSMANVLSLMEQRGLAHCDLSAPNILLPGLEAVALVDVEQLFAPGLDKPEHLPGGSPGYAMKRHEGAQAWNKYADRFAGSVLLAEMLAWCEPRIREAAWGESYFDPEAMQEDAARAELMTETLRQLYGDEAAGLFEQAWHAEDVHLCPTFGDWLMVITKAAARIEPGPELKPERKEPERSYQPEIQTIKPEQAKPAADSLSNERAGIAPASLAERVVLTTEPEQPLQAGRLMKPLASKAETQTAAVRTRLREAREMERTGDLQSAYSAYQSILEELPAESSLAVEVRMAAEEVRAALAGSRKKRMEGMDEPAAAPPAAVVQTASSVKQRGAKTAPGFYHYLWVAAWVVSGAAAVLSLLSYSP